MVWYFVGLYIINRTLHGRWRYEIYLLVLKKYFTRSLRSLVKYFLTVEEKFCISTLPCNIFYLLYRYWWNTRIFPFTKKSYLHRAQWRYYFCLSRVRILVSPWLLTRFALFISRYWEKESLHPLKPREVAQWPSGRKCKWYWYCPTSTKLRTSEDCYQWFFKEN